MSSPNEIHCLWIDQDTGEIHVIPASTPIEKNPLGFYVPHWSGTKEEMEKRKRKIIMQRMKPPKQTKEKRA